MSGLCKFMERNELLKMSHPILMNKSENMVC